MTYKPGSDSEELRESAEVWHEQGCVLCGGPSNGFRLCGRCLTEEQDRIEHATTEPPAFGVGAMGMSVYDDEALSIHDADKCRFMTEPCSICGRCAEDIARGE